MADMHVSVRSLASVLPCMLLGACEAHVEPAPAVPDSRVAPPRGASEATGQMPPATEALGRAAPELALGGAGYGWGDGLHGRGAPPRREGPIKREGDRRSPAGVFSLGTVYGYAATASALRLPYRQATADTRCVDDPGSAHYNQIVSIAETGERWRSAELMRRHDDLYELALEIEHNRSPVRAGHGSCIFAHVWAGPDVAVTGCTGFAKPDLRRLLEWLKPRSAAWVALPQEEYLTLRAAWGLP
jgi:hypothetical protein